MQMEGPVLQYRVYLEDTDAQGIVYHANYLRFFERGRSEILETLGVSVEQVALPDCRLVVYETRIRYRKPALLGDRIEVRTTLRRESAYRLSFLQKIRRCGEDEDLVVGEVDIVAIDRSGELRELPAVFGRD